MARSLSRSHGGTVLIRFTKPGALRPTTRRVPIAPAFDPDAISMSPIIGWTAALAALPDLSARTCSGHRPGALCGAVAA